MIKLLKMTDINTARICYNIFIKELKLKNSEYMPTSDEVKEMDAHELKSSLQVNYMIFLSESIVNPSTSSTCFQYQHLIKIINKCIDGFYEGALKDCQIKCKKLEKENNSLKAHLNSAHESPSKSQNSWF